MSSHPEYWRKFEILREKAERLIQAESPPASETPNDILDLIHELRIHQAEVEIQNEELKQAQQELIDLKREYENLYEFAPCGYITLNNKGIITHINLTGVKLIDEDRRKALHQGLTSFIEAGYDDVYLSVRRKSGETGEKQSVELPLKRANGPPLWVRADIDADKDVNDAVIQWRVVLLDISKQKEAQAKLLQAQKMESIGNLAGGIAHDFNNILSSIIGFTEVALDAVPKGTNLEGSLHEVYSAGRRAKDLVGQILTFARKSNEEVKPVNIAKLAKGALPLIRASIPTNIEIEQNISTTAKVVGNPSLLEQIFLNLSNNAADSMEDEGGKIVIAVSDVEIDERAASDHDLLGPGDYVEITISDTGVGIPPDSISSIFEPFFTTKGPGKGTGMGLASVYGTVRKYGGAISVKSRLGEGAVFTVLLPTTQKQEGTKTYQPEELPRGTERILFVDDEPAIVEIGSRNLESLGYSVTSCTSSTEALELFQARPDDFDLAITDMTMPKLTGDKLAAELMKIRHDIPIILCTGYSSKISEETASEIGIKAFAYKPILKADLATTIRKVLDDAKG